MRPPEDGRSLALEQYGAGPLGTLHLADLAYDRERIAALAAGGAFGAVPPPS